MNHAIEDIIAEAQAQGFKVDRTSKSHYRFCPPDVTKPIVIASSTPKDRCDARKWLLRDLRKSGFKIPQGMR